MNLISTIDKLNKDDKVRSYIEDIEKEMRRMADNFIGRPISHEDRMMLDRALEEQMRSLLPRDMIERVHVNIELNRDYQ